METISLIFFLIISLFGDVVLESSGSNNQHNFQDIYSRCDRKRRYENGMWFGEKVPSYDLETEANMRELYDNIIVPINEEITGSNLFNNIDNFMQVYNTFKNQTRFTSFQQFYQTYRVKYIPKVTAGSLLLELMHRIRGAYDASMGTATNIEGSMYLAASYNNIFGHGVSNIDQGKSEYLAETQKYASNVVGLLRITFNNRRGYILFDSYYITPQIIMEDGQIPYEGYYVKEGAKVYKTSLNSNYYIYRYQTGVVNAINNYHFINIECIIYADRPYCSFLETTEKYNLVMDPIKSIIKRNSKGQELGSIYFDVFIKAQWHSVHRRINSDTEISNTIHFIVNPISGSSFVDHEIKSKNILRYTENNQENETYIKNVSSNDSEIFHVYKTDPPGQAGVSKTARKRQKQPKMLSRDDQTYFMAMWHVLEWDSNVYWKKLNDIAKMLEDDEFTFDLYKLKLAIS